MENAVGGDLKDNVSSSVEISEPDRQKQKS